MNCVKKVHIENYNPQWASWFESLKDQIWPVVQKWATSIEHVGSTSVPCLAAKPVIDIDIVVEDVKRIQQVTRVLESIGYTHRGNLGIEGREAFRTPTGSLEHHLYVCLKDCAAQRRRSVA